MEAIGRPRAQSIAIPATLPALAVAGRGVLAGLTIYETAAANARMDLYDGNPNAGGERIAAYAMGANGGVTDFYANPSLQWVRELWVVVGAGAFAGNLFVVPQMLVNGLWVDDQTYGGGRVVETDDVHQVAAYFGAGDEGNSYEGM